MKIALRIFLCIVIVIRCNLLFAQKPLITPSAYSSWPSLGESKLSADGRYVGFVVANEPLGSSTLVLMSTDKKWKMEFIDAPRFILSNEYALIQKSDTVKIVKLGTSLIKVIPAIEFDTPMTESPWFAFRPKSFPGRLMVRNLLTGEEKRIEDVRTYNFSKEGRLLILQKTINLTMTNELQVLELNTGKIQSIWSGEGICGVTIDEKHYQVAFSVRNKINNTNEFWYRDLQKGNTRLLIDSVPASIGTNLQLGSIAMFGENGRQIFFKFKRTIPSQTKESLVSLNVRNYKDIRPVSQSGPAIVKQEDYLGVISLENNQVARLQKDNDRFITVLNDQWSKVASVPDERKPGITYLVSNLDGSRKELPYNFKVSPNGKWIVYFDLKFDTCYAYDLTTKQIKRVSIGSDDSKQIASRLSSSAPSNHSGIAGWDINSDLVYIYGKYDIWCLSLSGNKMPINVTNGYGKKKEIVFNFLTPLTAFINSERLVVLRAFNKVDKTSGFYSIDCKRIQDPQLLYMDSCLFGSDPVVCEPITSLNGATYLVQRCKANESPNYVCTKDFRHFTTLSDVHSERNYNWLTTKLVNWKSAEGVNLQGVLYLPGDFDATKRYPIIFYYYEQMSDNLNVFLRPDYSGGALNVPWYVSNGYLVFTPDIIYKKGYTGASALSSVESAARYLRSFSFVDSTKMGIQGVSMGGFETNYIVTHTDIFAAACSASGIYDLVSAYNNIQDISNLSNQFQFETGQFRIGATLWKSPELFIENSPVFAADKVTTPILMMQTTVDGRTPLSNSLEFLVAMNRLGKKAWYLQYDEGSHGLSGKESEDFDERMRQFFGYYLKGDPPPKWMTNDVSIRPRTWEEDKDADLSGKVPPP